MEREVLAAIFMFGAVAFGLIALFWIETQPHISDEMKSAALQYLMDQWALPTISPYVGSSPSECDAADRRLAALRVEIEKFTDHQWKAACLAWVEHGEWAVMRSRDAWRREREVAEIVREKSKGHG